MEKISLKKRYVRTNAWRGYYQFINAACGANDTGTWSDSPCPTDICHAELTRAAMILRKAGIRYKRAYCNTSNVFCAHCYLIVPESKVEAAKELIRPIISETRLLYIA